MIRILIVDDQSFSRKAINAILEPELNFSLVGEAKNGVEALKFMNQMTIDIAIVDLEMPEMNGFELTEKICQSFPATKVIILSSDEDQYSINKAVKSGARGYLLKDTSTEDEMVETINYVQRGYFQLGPGLFEKLISNLISHEAKTSQNLSQIEINHHQNVAQLREEILFQSQQVRDQVFHELNLEITNLKFDFREGLNDFQKQVSKQIEGGFDDFTKSQPQSQFIPDLWHKRYFKLSQNISLIESTAHLAINKLKQEILILRYCIIFLLILFVPVLVDYLFGF